MDLDHETAATLFKLIFLAVLGYDVWLLLRPPPWSQAVMGSKLCAGNVRGKESSKGSDPIWQARTRVELELYRHGINTYLFPLTVVVVLMIDLSQDTAPGVVGLDLTLLLLVVVYLTWPRILALLADGGLWLDGMRLDPDRLAGFETVKDHPRTLIVATDWRGLLVRRRVVLARADEVEAFMSAWQKTRKEEPTDSGQQADKQGPTS